MTTRKNALTFPQKINDLISSNKPDVPHRNAVLTSQPSYLSW